MIAINTLQSLASRYLPDASPAKDVLYVPMLDARRMEVYCAAYDKDLNEVLPTHARIIDAESFAEVEGSQKLLLFGNGALKCEGVIARAGTAFVHHIHCSAAGMAALAHASFLRQDFVDTGWFEPYYLKDFAGTKPGKK
jgi:tRNA threonylcarbamoyladenosine biosynthesis protein TsaB